MAGSAGAQEKFPTKTVRIVVGYGPGTTSDVFVRLIANALLQRWGQAVIVENKLGAAGDMVAGTQVLCDTLVALSCMDTPLR